MKLQRSRYTQTLTITTSDTDANSYINRLQFAVTSYNSDHIWMIWYDNFRICVFELIQIKFTCIPSFSKITLIMSDYHIESFLMISTYLVRGKNFITKKWFGLFWGILKVSNCKISHWHCQKRIVFSLLPYNDIVIKDF